MMKECAFPQCAAKGHFSSGHLVITKNLMKVPSLPISSKCEILHILEKDNGPFKTNWFRLLFSLTFGVPGPYFKYDTSESPPLDLQSGLLGEFKWFKICLSMLLTEFSLVVSTSFQEKLLGSFWSEALPVWVLYTKVLVVLPSLVPSVPSYELATRLRQHLLTRNCFLICNKTWSAQGNRSASIEFNSLQYWVRTKSFFGLKLGAGLQRDVTPNGVVFPMHRSLLNKNALT